MAKDLTNKQRRFVEEYLKDLNSAAACVRAGYSARNSDKIGFQLMGKTRVKAAVEAAMAERAKRNNIDSDWVLRKVVLLVRMCMQAGVKDGASAAFKGLDLLGKHLGMWDKRQADGGSTAELARKAIIEALLQDAKPAPIDSISAPKP